MYNFPLLTISQLLVTWPHLTAEGTKLSKLYSEHSCEYLPIMGSITIEGEKRYLRTTNIEPISASTNSRLNLSTWIDENIIEFFVRVAEHSYFRR